MFPKKDILLYKKSTIIKSMKYNIDTLIYRLNSNFSYCPSNVLYSKGATPYPGITCVFLASFNLEWLPSLSLSFMSNIFVEYEPSYFIECHPI